MFTPLDEPAGAWEASGLAAALVLAAVGAVGAVTMIALAAVGSDYWSDQRSDQLLSAAMFALMVVGAAGFLVMDRRPWPGAGLAVVGSLIFGVILWWTIAAVILGLLFVVVAVLRARTFHQLGARRPPPPLTA